MTSPFTVGSWSRRRILAASGAASALALPGVSLAQQITANASLQPAPDQDSAKLGAKTDASSHLTIEVRVNGRPLRFVVDTAAERSVIADDAAAALGLAAGPLVLVDGIAKRIEAPSARVSELSFGPFTLNNLVLPVLPRVSLAADGYLGLDAINNSRVTFDFKNRQLMVEQPRYAQKPPERGIESTLVHLRGSSGHLRVTDCLVDSVPAQAFIDTGAEVSVGSPTLYNALLQRNKYLVETGAMVLTGVTGGEVTGQIIPVQRIRLQNLSFTDGSIVIADVPDFETFGVKIRPAVLIGMDFLRQFASVSIDYRSKEVRFDLSLAPPLRTPGVEIAANA